MCADNDTALLVKWQNDNAELLSAMAVLAGSTAASFKRIPTVRTPKPKPVLSDYFAGGRVPTASEIFRFAEVREWKYSKSENGPITFKDENGIKRITLKQGCQRTAGSESPLVEIGDADGVRIYPFGNEVTRKSPGNHTPIDWDLS